MSTVSLPHPKQVRDLFADLLGREIAIAPGEPVVPTREVRAAVGVYVDEQLGMAAAVAADLSLAAHAGAALGLIPVDTALAAIEEAVLPANVWENFAELLNIFASLLNRDDGPHLRLYASYGPDALPPNDIGEVLRGFGGRLDLGIDVAGYGSGLLSVVRAV